MSAGTTPPFIDAANLSAMSRKPFAAAASGVVTLSPRFTISALACSSCCGTSLSSASWVLLAMARIWVRSLASMLFHTFASMTVAPASGPTPRSSICGTLRYH
jgi:hypothetical protein